MRLHAFALTVVLSACSAVPPPGNPGPIRELTGRVAGPAQKCITFNSYEALRTVDGDRHTLAYGSGRTIWLNHLGGGCGFGSNDVIVVEPFGSSLCRGDIVRSVDALSHIPGPSCVLSEFVPYTR